MKELEIFKYTPDEEKLILDKFRKAQKSDFHEDLMDAVRKIQKKIGHVDLQQIELLLRKNDMEAGFVTVPREKHPFAESWEVYDPNNPEKSLQKIAIPVLTREEANMIAVEFGFVFDPFLNIADLKDAGFIRPKNLKGPKNRIGSWQVIN